MLAPGDRRLLLDVLAPPQDYSLDHAIGTTYSLDLLALLRVPLAATAMPWSSTNGGPVENPFALLNALRRNAGRISLFCHAGATKVPAAHIPLLVFLEGCVHPVTTPTPGGLFHPKCWVLRLTPASENAPIRYRLLILSRNLTFDRAWDVALTLDGVLGVRRPNGDGNGPLAEFVAALPAMAAAAGQDPPKPTHDRVTLIADEIRRVHWTLPEGFEHIAFHPIGHDGTPRWPIKDLFRLMIIAPFAGAPALARFKQEVRSDVTLISRFEELEQIDGSALADLIDDVQVFDDQSPSLDVGDGDAEALGEPRGNELTGLHAKVFVGERHRRAAVYIGSANATESAFERNVELLVELIGSRTQHGVDRVRGLLDAGNLLRPFRPVGVPPEPSPTDALDRLLEQIAHRLAAGALRASVEPIGDDRWRMLLHAAPVADVGRVTIYARPLSLHSRQRLDLHGEPAATFPPTTLTSVTPFFALHLSAHTEDGIEQHLEVAVRLALAGAPEGRAEAVTADLLSDSDRLLRFIALLLADDGDSDRMLDELADLFTERRAGSSPNGATDVLGLPLLEPMLRALHRNPERLDEVDRLLSDMKAAGASIDALIPPELEQLWTTISAARRRKR